MFIIFLYFRGAITNALLVILDTNATQTLSIRIKWLYQIRELFNCANIICSFFLVVSLHHVAPRHFIISFDVVKRGFMLLSSYIFFYQIKLLSNIMNIDF